MKERFDGAVTCCPPRRSEKLPFYLLIEGPFSGASIELRYTGSLWSGLVLLYWNWAPSFEEAHRHLMAVVKAEKAEGCK